MSSFVDNGSLKELNAMIIFRVPYGVLLNSFVKKGVFFLFFISFQISFGQTQSNDFDSNKILDFEYTIYPNPSKDHIFFKTLQVYEGLNISIINANGQAVKVIIPKEQNTVKIDLSGFPNGIYFMRIKSREEILGIKQFIISK